MLQPDGFSFSISDKEDNERKFIVETLTFDVQNATPQEQINFLAHSFLENEHLSNQTFESVQMVHANNLSTFVPKPFFKEENMAEYLKYNIKVLQNDLIVYDAIEGSEMMNVYIPFVHLNNFFFDKFGSFIYKHSATVWIESLLASSDKSEKEKFFVNVENGFFQIAIIKNKELILYNAFNYKTKEDFIYYILFTAEQLKMNPDEFHLFLSGQIDEASVLYKIVYTYVRNVHFLNNKLHANNHQNYILLSQTL